MLRATIVSPPERRDVSEQIQWRRMSSQFAILHRASEFLGVPVDYDRCGKVEPRNSELPGFGCPVADFSLSSDLYCSRQRMVRLALVQAEITRCCMSISSAQ